MPRVSNVYAPPAGTLATSGAPISSSAYNGFVNDLVADLNAPRPISAGGTGGTSGSAARTALGVAIGTDVQAFDAKLAALSGLAPSAGSLAYFTSSTAMATVATTAYGRALLNAADEAGFKALVNLEAGVDIQAYSARLADLAGISWASGDFAYYNGANLVRLAKGTSFQSLGMNPTASAPAYQPGIGAMVNFDGNPVTIRSSFNVASITRNGAGDYSINFTTAMPNTNYVVIITAGGTGTAAPGNVVVAWAAVYATTSIRIGVSDNNADTNLDADNINVVVYVA